MKPLSYMKNQFRDLQLHQTDELLARMTSLCMSPRPRSGWVKSIREALGMSASAFARRLGMSHAGVRKLELAEANDAISLASLRKMAEALDCELHYALIPRTSLAQQLQARAEVVVTERMRPILHTMALEDQAVQSSVNKFQFESSVKDLIEGSRRELW
ncbi:mob_myst_A, mobile mystery protein A [Burkholderiaceae bacterium]